MATRTHGSKHKTNGHATRYVSSLGSKTRRLLARNKRKLSSTTNRITHAAHDAREKFVDAEQTVQKFAKTHPWKTIGWSVLAGALVGRIFTGRK